jgi:hypothetical protein
MIVAELRLFEVGCKKKRIVAMYICRMERTKDRKNDSVKITHSTDSRKSCRSCISAQTTAVLSTS